MAKSHASAWASDAPTPAQFKEFFSQVDSGKVTKDRLQAFLRGEVSPNDTRATDVSVQSLLSDWERFYKKHFGMDRDFLSGLRIPERKEGFTRLIVVAQGMTPEKIFAKVKSAMPAWKYWGNLDGIVSDRRADHDYAIWIRDRVEADEELKSRSANDLKKEGIPGITLEERLLYELKFFEETGKHLDVQNITLCAGSRSPDGSVPSVHWGGDEAHVHVDWYDPVSRRGLLRSRAVVS